MTDFRIGIDWRRKGYICRDARPGDPLNVLPTPITHAAIAHKQHGGSTVQQVTIPTHMGDKVAYNVTSGTATRSGLRLGAAPPNVVDTIPVQPTTTYTVRLRSRVLSGHTDVPFVLVIRDNNTLLGADSFTGSQAFATRTATFTTDSLSEFVVFNIFTDQAPEGVRFQVLDVMLVEGDTMPAGHNMGQTIDLYDDITDRVLSANWFVGMRNAYQDVADDSMLKLDLDNSDRRFSPEYTDSPLNETDVITIDGEDITRQTNYRMPFRPVEVVSRGPKYPPALDNGEQTWRTHYRGWIESIRPHVNPHGDRRATLTCAGPMLFFKRVDAAVELQQNQRTDTIVNRLLDEVPLPATLAERPLLGDVRCRVGHVVLPDITLPRTLEDGKTTLQYAADNWIQNDTGGKAADRTFNVYQAIQDTTAAERGRFFFNRSGEAVFWNRHYLLKKAVPGLLPESTEMHFDSDIIDMDYEYAGLDEFVNEMRVTCHPRTLSAGDHILLHELVYDPNNPKPGIVVPPGEEKVVNISFRDENSNRVGALNARLINVRWSGGVAVDWQTDDGQSGTNFLNVPPGTVTLDATASGARLRVRAGATHVHLLSYEVHGQAIYDNGPVEAVAEDRMSITRYGRRTQILNIAALDRPAFAQEVADFEVHRRSKPRGAIRQMTLRSHAIEQGSRHHAQLSRTIGHWMRVHESQTGHDRSYAIIGEAHRLSDGDTLLETTWYLEPLTRETWAILPSDAKAPGAPTLSDGQTEPFYRVAY